MKKYKISLLASLALFPSSTFAAFTGTTDLINAFGGLIGSMFAILVALALAVFFWGLVKFIFKVGGSEDSVKEGKRTMGWGIIALFVMVSIWGIINFIGDELGISAGGNNPGGSQGGGGGGGGGSSGCVGVVC